MNTSRCNTRKRPRSIQKLTATLQEVAGDLALIDDAIKAQQARQVSPLMTVPRFDGETIYKLCLSTWGVVEFGQRLEEVAREVS